MKQTRLSVLKKQGGQSLFELVIMIGVLTVILGGLSITIITGLMNTQFAQNQIQASKYAQEGMERIKSMRETNIPICFSGNPYFWRVTGVQSSVWTNNLSGVPYYFGNETVGVNPSCSVTDNKTYADPTEYKSGLLGKFIRKIQITDIDSTQKKFTVQVDWTDISGTHQSTLISIISDHL